MIQGFSSELEELCRRAEAIAENVLFPNAEQVDTTFSWPEEGMRALADAGLTALTIPLELGGHGQGLLGMAALTEILGRACSSSALCFGMHCVGTAVIAAKATDYQREHYLAPIAAGNHVTTLALSEGGSGASFFLPETTVVRSDDAFVVNGIKKFVTSGGHADSYVISTVAAGGTAAGEFDCLIVDRDLPGMRWSDSWRGFGMHGNSSRTLALENVTLPLGNLLGETGEQPWYVFEVIAPYFLTAMAGTYLGIAQAALDLTVEHVKARHHSHYWRALSDIETIQHRIGSLWADVEKSRLLLYEAGNAADIGAPNAMALILSCKAEIADTVVRVTNEAMTLCGGIAYGENSRLARLLRDARASHVMAPTTDMLKIWTGRTLLGLPLL